MRRFAALAVLLLAGLCARAEDVFDEVDQSLTTSAFNDVFRVRLSGTIDLEGYHTSEPGPGLIDSDKPDLFNPRLSLFLDAQIGSTLYVFVESRADRGFDPTDGPAKLRLDEYAVRYTPWKSGVLNVQIGKFATVVGNWVARHDSWDNPFITAPLPYENLTGIWDVIAASRASEVLNWAGLRPVTSGAVIAPYRSVPIIWGPSYASGAAVSGESGSFNYAVEVKNTSLSSRPETWSPSQSQWQEPTFSARLGYVPNEMFSFGVSASEGSYLLSSAANTLSPGYGLGNYREVLFGQDAAYAWHHLQLWAEVFETRFEIPKVGNADTIAYYLEGKYKLTPQLFAALRWNQQVFSSLVDASNGPFRWSRNVWRIDAGPGYRFSSNIQLKAQYSVQSEDHSSAKFERLFAGQLTVRF